MHKHAEIGVGREPTSIAAHPDNNTAYVANAGDGTVSVLNIPSGKVRGTIRVGAEPMAVALSPNGSRLYVANSASTNLSQFKVDTSTGALTALTSSAAGTGTNPESIVVDPDAKFIFVINERSNSITEFTINKDGTLATTAPDTVADVRNNLIWEFSDYGTLAFNNTKTKWAWSART